MELLFQITGRELLISGWASNDYLKLFVDVTKLPNFHSISRREFFDLLEPHVLLEKIDIGVIDDIIKQLKFGDSFVAQRRIVSGDPPEPGIDGKIIINVQQLTQETHRELSPNDIADLHQLHLFDNIRKDQIIGRIYHPKPGIDGIDILGRRIISHCGQPASHCFDDTIDCIPPDESGLGYDLLVARQDGCLSLDSKRYTIQPTIKVDHDLDYRWGNIDFVGKVSVRGDVMPGFNIKANKGIYIQGSVRGGSLIASEGDVTVSEYAFGGQESMIMAGKNFSATVVQEVNTEVIGDIYIRKEAINSQLRTSGHLYMPDGALVGGKVFSVKGVEARTIGAEAGTRTVIHLSSDIEASLLYSRLLIEIELMTKKISSLQMQLGPIVDNPEIISELEDQQRTKMGAIYERFLVALSAKRSLTRQKMQIVTQAKMCSVLRVNFHHRMYDGAIVIVSGCQFSPEKPIDGPASLDFDLREKKFKIGPLQSLPGT